MLTATPIQNRLWDLYSLVDLLTVARGHKNPFGSEGEFARKFIADKRDQARRLKPEARDEFRSVIYGYMSRVRRRDAMLYFPERVVQMHRVDPSAAELELIRAIAEPIQSLKNRLAQISILQALTSSPDALAAQLRNMAKNKTVPQELAERVRAIVARSPDSAKLQGLGALVARLKSENPERWRLVVFTGRRETQTTIQVFLERQGLKVGVIHGATGSRNQETLARFRKNPPGYHVIVSTEAGSEGVNLQVANVLVNYDLPWNPMIVEQRIGRIQRLSSEHARVSVFNIMLTDTFEEYIVGCLMEKRQMATHAIGDIDALLEASGIDEEYEDVATGFEERIRQLVVAALAGKDVEAATRLAEESIVKAETELKNRQEYLDTMLGGMDGAEYVGPRAPTLPPVIWSMKPREFTLAAFRSFGAHITRKAPDLYLVQENGGRAYVRFEENSVAGAKGSLYGPGTPAFMHLVDRVVATGIHDVEDIDRNPAEESEKIARRWVLSFGGTPMEVEIQEVRRCFEGIAVVRVRATVAHDSCERLIEITCSPDEHYADAGRAGLLPLASTIEDPVAVGLNADGLVDRASLDDAISEFCRFYLERREREVQAAGDDDRRRKKLEDDFTPRLVSTLVALEGKLHRRLRVRVRYDIDAGSDYCSTLAVTPHIGEVTDPPQRGSCSRSGRTVPKECLEQCEITGAEVLRHLLVRSETSSRPALPEFTVVCGLSGKRVLRDEAEPSAVSGRLVASAFLKTSTLSGKRAESCYFGQCEFTKAVVLDAELATSEVSGKRYRMDEQMRSAVSGKTGHKQEFLVCHESGQLLAVSEAEQCEVSGTLVRPGVLEPCAITQKRVLPSELERCAATGKRALKRFFITSSLSGARILEEVAVRSLTGKWCAPVEAKACFWSGRTCHPDDLRVCELTGLPIHFEFAAADGHPRLQPLVDLLDGVKRTADEAQLWDAVATKGAEALRGGRCRVEAATLSPTRRHLAVCCEVRAWFGLRLRHAGLVFTIGDGSLVGRVTQGRRVSERWSELKR